MKRRIAAVLMADVAGMSQAFADDEAAALRRVGEYRGVIEDIVSHGGGVTLPAVGEAVLAVFHSAVQAVRAAIEVQETLRARNRALSLAERLDYRLAITIGEVAEGEGRSEVASETLAGAAHLVALAAPGGVCISRSVRESVANKIALKFQDLTVAGAPIEPEPSIYRVAHERPAPLARRPVHVFGRVSTPFVVVGAAGLVVLGAVGALLVSGGGSSRPQSVADAPRAPETTAPQASAREPASVPAKPAPAGGGGKIEFLPGHQAPDPSAVLTARRLMPNAWRDCRLAKGEAALAACKTLLDSGIPKEGELADIHLWTGKALREARQFDKAIDALTASIAARPTATAYSLRGTVHFDKGTFEAAIADYTEAIRIDATSGEAFNNRAWTYYRAGRAREALSDADTAVRLLGKEAFVWDTRAHIHANLGNRDAAISDFRAALAIDPANAASKEGLARLGAK